LSLLSLAALIILSRREKRSHLPDVLPDLEV